MRLGDAQQFASPQATIEHYGVKGMKWGVRKERTPVPLAVRSPGVTVRKDGSMDIAPGANLQRLARANGKSLPMKDITYASLNEYDNAKYIKTIGGKGFFGGGRDQILTIQATKSIKAPSVNDATKIVSKMMVENAEFRKQNTDILGRNISDKELAEIKKDPLGKTAQAWYWQTNQKLTFDPAFDPKSPAVQKAVREEMKKNGYNALRDENDASKISKAPIIIFDPQHSVKVVKVTDITDELRKANKAKLKQYKKNGKDWVDSQLYN